MKNPGSVVSSLVEEALARLEKYTGRDAEFLARFGRWERPSFAPRYNLDALVALVRWSPWDPSILDAEPLILHLAPEDRRIAAEIARFVAEEYENAPASDVTLKLFRLNLARRLDACGF